MSRRVGVLCLLAAGVRAHWVRQEQEVPTYNAETSLWVQSDRAPADHTVTLTVAMRIDGGRRAELERVFWEVSDPKHENYGKHKTIDEITEIMAVPQRNVDAVKQHFQAHSAVVVVAPNRDMMTVTMPIASAEKALSTTLHYFTHSEQKDVRILRASQHYSLPADVAEFVSMVGELLQFPRLKSTSLSNLQGGGSWPNSCAASGCNGLVQPAVLMERYKLPSSAAVNDANSMAVAEFQGQYYKDSDLKTFSSSCKTSVTVAKTIGGNQQKAGVESELDIEYIKSVAPDVPLTVVYSNDFSLLNWANQITSLSDSPLVHSVSYGNDEIQQTSTEYMYTCNTAFMKAGARGLSILFASGDQGVCGRSGCGLIWHSRFHPDFPAASPYITAVGGTDFVGSSIGDEMVWSAGGGGFSDTFGIPDYQKDAVAGYLASKDANFPPQKLWNNTGRGYPDVSALGGQKAPYCVAVNGMFSGVAGTSASCPVVAGVFAKLNGLRLAAGKKPMGFLNPFIYQNPSGFQDVTVGTNGAAKKYGFTAVKGWDAASGHGTPNFEALSKLSMAVVEETGSVVV